MLRRYGLCLNPAPSTSATMASMPMGGKQWPPLVWYTSRVPNPIG